MAKLRFGLVLTTAGGVLGKMLPPFQARPGWQAGGWEAVHELDLHGGPPRRRASHDRRAGAERSHQRHVAQPGHQRGIHSHAGTGAGTTDALSRSRRWSCARCSDRWRTRCCWEVHASCPRNWSRSGFRLSIPPAGAGVAGRASGLRHRARRGDQASRHRPALRGTRFGYRARHRQGRGLRRASP